MTERRVLLCRHCNRTLGVVVLVLDVDVPLGHILVRILEAILCRRHERVRRGWTLPSETSTRAGAERVPSSLMVASQRWAGPRWPKLWSTKGGRVGTAELARTAVARPLCFTMRPAPSQDACRHWGIHTHCSALHAQVPSFFIEPFISRRPASTFRFCCIRAANLHGATCLQQQ